ncbi:UDP-glucuronosyltransferase 2B13-like [Sardina pilchardus]|uniref:UDP-glucuronosyltransferase 2B13-like n=1 Tax=Sardina pilchardus TaxID=27697 RepID=UPI002E155462
MDILIRMLHDRGHSITVLQSSKSWYIKEDSAYYNSITVPVEKGFNKEYIRPMISKYLEMKRENSSLINFIHLQAIMSTYIYKIHGISSHMASSIFEDRALTQGLNKSQFDMVLTDPAVSEGILLAHYLKLPLVYHVRWVTSTDGHRSVAPSPVSYIPITYSGLSDKMTFLQRVTNMCFYLFYQFELTFLIQSQHQAVCDNYFEPKVKFHELVQAADIWLMRVDFLFEFPRPTMPNIVYVGGLQCKPAKPLPQDLEDFVQSSGEHGVIIMSMGTLIGELPSDLTEEIAAAFAELPQKVIWRHFGKIPSTLGNNTLLVKWIPQNDLLGHPKTRVFIAHGGTNGLQEAIYHGVPVIGIPIFFDQHDNVVRLKERGSAKLLILSTINRDTFLRALQEVLHEPSYKENMQRLSRIHHDQPMRPMDQALYWIEFVMRHKGAAHLRTESYKMPWYSYHSVDVVVFLITVFSCALLMLFASCKYVLGLCYKQKIKRD